MANENKQKQKLREVFLDHIDQKGRRPYSISELLEYGKIHGDQFQLAYHSVADLEQSLWQEFFKDTLADLENDSAYSEYSAREKLLAFYFTWFEKLTEIRTYAVYRFARVRPHLIGPGYLDALRRSLTDFLKSLIQEAVSRDEVPDRIVLYKSYPGILWYQFRFLMRFWCRDNSNQNIKTDAAIEKLVNFSFDLMERNAFDSMVDVGKFFYQNGDKIIGRKK